MTVDELLDAYVDALEELKTLRGDPRARKAWEIASTSAEVAAAYRALYPNEPLPLNPALERLAVEYENAGRYADAIAVCEKALSEGWRDVGYQHRIDRCRKNMAEEKPPRGYTDPGRKNVQCQQCGREMHKTVRGQSNFVAQVFGVVLFIVGLVLLVFFPIGTLIGALLMVASLKMGYTRTKVWMCNSCGYFFERGK